MTITDSTISGNVVINDEDSASGGGIDARGNATIARSTISGNLVSGTSNGFGGGLYAEGDVTVSDSTLSSNTAMSGSFRSAGGGGTFARGDATVVRSTISDNHVSGGFQAFGGGVFSSDEVLVSHSTISGNSVEGGINNTVFGGGVMSFGPLTVRGSTISGNSLTADSFSLLRGVGLASYDPVTISESTITGHSGSLNGFPIETIWSDGNPLTIEHSILAGNELDLGAQSELTLRHSLIGDNSFSNLSPAPVGMPDANGNLIGTAAAPIDPLLGPLQDNGGPTFTHELLAGSPAIDAGDNAVAPATDQRGFVRIVDGGSGQKIIDMGAYEFGATLAGDGNGDGFVGDADYTVWANNFGISGEDIPGDYNNDGVVGPQDYTVWANNFGAGTPPSEIAISQRPVEPALQNFAAGLLTEPLTPGATGSASASGVSTANPQQHHRPVEPALPTATLRRDKPSGSLAAAHDAAIQELMIEGFGRNDPVSRSSIDHIWALLNAGLFETDHAEMLIDVSERGN